MSQSQAKPNQIKSQISKFWRRMTHQVQDIPHKHHTQCTVQETQGLHVYFQISKINTQLKFKTFILYALSSVHIPYIMTNESLESGEYNILEKY